MTSSAAEVLLDRVTRTARGCALRGGVHAGSLIFVLLTAAMATPSLPPVALLALYAGLVTLFGRFLFQPFGGLVPLGAGLLQALVASAQGLDLPAILLLAGLQAWIQDTVVGRRILLVGDDNTLDLRDMLAGGVLALCAVLLLSSGALTAWSLAGLGAGVAMGLGLWGVALVSARRTSRRGLDALRELLDEKKRLPAMLDQPVTRLVTVGERYVTPPLSGMARQVFPFARALRPLERRILAVSFCADPADRLRQAERLFTRLRRENADLARTAPGGAAAPAASAAGRAFFNDIDYRLKIANLEAFSERLPATLAPRIRDICHAAENIMEAMRADASRIPEGERFLTRYLDATTALVERWCRLPENRAPETGEADARLLALLDRLEEAFACKHARLLESDRLEYTADLNTLDRLLDMEGNRT